MFSTSSRRYVSDTTQDRATLSEFKKAIAFPREDCTLKQLAENGLEYIDRKIVLHGYLGTRRVANKALVFAELKDKDLHSVVQLVSSLSKNVDSTSTSHQLVKDLLDHTPVAIEGTVKTRRTSKSSAGDDSVHGNLSVVSNVEIRVTGVTPLNTFPTDVTMGEETVFGPAQRHLQIRNDTTLRNALIFRSKVARFIRQHLADDHGFIEIETPLLFKSTPEGAREFLVPTRTPGMAYALPQSPQQYKQILMASGIPRYMQIAKCFRDEDLRADRQPEFTQIDLEIAFASGEDVMRIVESTVKALWQHMLGAQKFPDKFERLTYENAMSRYGSDKPDTRLGSEIRRVEYMLPVDLISKIGPLMEPIVEVMRVPISENPEETRRFVSTFMDSPEAQPFINNPEGQPGIFIFDSRKPLQGLSVFGFEAAEQAEEMLSLEDGDMVVLQARKKALFAGGSTPIGNLRLALHRAAVKHDFLPPPTGFNFLWITDFPLFSPTTEADPGQGGFAGLSATHHPFTAPKTPADVDLLLTAPLEAKADHYDLVVNGVELGGGSRRIHHAGIQELVMREVLRMSEERIKDFAHLIDVLRSGCPPHAGLALGFDRLVAVMLGKESVRDVIAFPKSGRGEDMLVKSPTMMTESQMETYHLQLRN